MALGGPVGAIVGGLVATATTGTALEALDEYHGGKRIEEIEADDKDDDASSKKKSLLGD